MFYLSYILFIYLSSLSAICFSSVCVCVCVCERERDLLSGWGSAAHACGSHLEGREDMFATVEEEPAAWLPVAVTGRRLLSASSPTHHPSILLLLLLLLFLSSYCSSSIPVPPGSMKNSLPHGSLPAAMGRKPSTALLCWYRDIPLIQIWIMHLIFLATLLVSVLSPWLHPSLASSGTYWPRPAAFLSLWCQEIASTLHFDLNADWRWSAGASLCVSSPR